MVRNLILVALVALAVTLYALIECVRTRPRDVRSLSKPAWVLAILLLPLVGAILWFWLGRPRQGSGSRGYGGQRRPAGGQRPSGAPDDDEQFLRGLEAQRRQKAREQARAEEQRRKEEELRELEDKFKNPPADSPDSPSEK